MTVHIARIPCPRIEPEVQATYASPSIRASLAQLRAVDGPVAALARQPAE